MSAATDLQPAPYLPGMLVRFPVDEDAEADDFRDFRIGRIEAIDLAADTVLITAWMYDISEAAHGIVAAEHRATRPLHQVARCRVLPDSPCTLLSTAECARVLVCADDGWAAGVHLAYYVWVAGAVRRVSEADMRVGSTRQDYSPVEQALRYELQNPAWRQPRDAIVQRYSELRSATLGIDELVASRVFLLAHQAEVIVRVLSSPQCRFMLADEVGLGKTIEACVILKALRRRIDNFKAVIIAPAALTHQWRNELSTKFWLDFPIADVEQQPRLSPLCPGLIISTEQLATHWDWVQRQPWDLLIVDEAHHLQKQPALYQQVRWLSNAIDRTLILTATPIQRRATEYLALLKLLDPRRYGAESERSFARILAAQTAVRKAITLVRQQLDPERFDWEEFSEDIAELGEELADDAALAQMLAALAQQQSDPAAALDTARALVAYVSENYRIERRSIRNRRASLGIALPYRLLDTSYSYAPADAEEQALDDLYDYAQRYLAALAADDLALEYARTLLYAAASSPQALLSLLRWRAEALTQGIAAEDRHALLAPMAPRQERGRLRRLVASAPAIPEERDLLAPLVRQIAYWREQSDLALSSLRRASVGVAAPHRLAQCLRAAHNGVAGNDTAKVIIFSGWTETAELLVPHLAHLLGRGAVAQFTSSMSDEALQQAADQFQSDPACCILVCDELGGEGRNFQIASSIIHVDIPWTPAQVEQRIGRVDRLGRTGAVRSVALYAHNTVEHDLFRIWDEALHLFTQSMSGMEIALEATQDALVASLAKSVRQGVADLLSPMRLKAKGLREAVEQERYFEEAAISTELRDEFERVSQSYRDGRAMRDAMQGWTALAGLANYHIEGEQMTYDARRFRLAAMRKARFLPPNMEEAARRSGRRRTTQIVGTFNRDVAVQREDLVFFAPGDDPWTDAVIANALECDRGRCCAVGFPPEPGATEPFFELLYSFHIDPRALYAAGLAPVHLLQAQSFLAAPHKRVLVDAQGIRVRPSDRRCKLIERPFNKLTFTHLGRRAHDKPQSSSHLDQLQGRYPADVWGDMVRAAIVTAEQFLDSDIGELSAELAGQAAQEFSRRAAGWEAGIRWQAHHGAQSMGESKELRVYRRAADALVAGIGHPIRRLESICFWQPSGGRDEY